MKYELCKHVMTEEKRRKGFDALAKQTFSLSFEKWYEDGDWSDWNRPYTLFDGEKAISNITVNQMQVFYQGNVRRYIQLGGVMTDPAYRGQGLSRFLMEEVKKDFLPECDAMFLLANRSVVDFYPKFGFVEEPQFQYFLQKKNGVQDFHLTKQNEKRLNMSKWEDIQTLLRCYQKKNPFSALQVIENSSLLLFYCKTVLKDCVYYLPEEDAVFIAEVMPKGLRCYDIYCDGNKSLDQMLHVFCGDNLPEVELLFTPVQQEKCIIKEYKDEDTHLFVMGEKENIFRGTQLYFPEISHT